MTRLVLGMLVVPLFALATTGRARAEDVAVPPAAPVLHPKPPLELGLGALQLAAGYGVELGGGLALSESLRRWKPGSDYATLALATSVVPAFAAGAVCGVGAFSRSYEGGCATSFLGAYAGAALGVVLGMVFAPRPGPDDTVAFERSMTALVGMAVLSPIGALIGHEVGKHALW